MNEIKTGKVIEMNDDPWQVLESHHLKVAQRRPVMQTKLRNLKTGKVLEHTFQQSDKVSEADVEKRDAKFQYRTKDEFFFITAQGKKQGFSAEDLGERTHYLIKDLPVTIVFFNDEPLDVELPIKVSLRVKDAPPAIKGDTVQGGLKDVVLETGAVVKTPLFINEGELVEIDTRDGSYVRRANE